MCMTIGHFRAKWREKQQELQSTIILMLHLDLYNIVIITDAATQLASITSYSCFLLSLPGVNAKQRSEHCEAPTVVHSHSSVVFWFLVE